MTYQEIVIIVFAFVLINVTSSKRRISNIDDFPRDPRGQQRHYDTSKPRSGRPSEPLGSFYKEDHYEE